MEEQDALAHVKAAAAVLGLPLDAGRAAAAAQQFARTMALARLLAQVPLGPHDEPAELYRAAPFPDEELSA